QGDGKIVAAGSTETTQYLHERDFAVARYNPNGSLDATFGTGGTVTTAFGFLTDGNAIALQGDGKIVVAGDTVAYDPITGDPEFTFALARYNLAGSLDATFGTGGTVTTAFGAPSEAHADAVALQVDDKIVAAGGTYTDPVNSITSFALARYLNGTTGTTTTTSTTRPPTTSTTPTTRP